MDVKAEHFERHVQRLEQERDQWEKKYEVRPCFYNLWTGHRAWMNSLTILLQEMQEKYKKSQAELDELVQNMEGL